MPIMAPVRIRRRDYDKSIKLLEKSLSFDENNTDAIYFLGRCYQQKIRCREGKELLQQDCR